MSNQFPQFDPASDSYLFCTSLYADMSNPSLSDYWRGNSPSGLSTNESNRKQSIEKCIQSLVHAAQCRDDDANCPDPSCVKMKRVVQHNKSCNEKNEILAQGPGGVKVCTICKHFIALCCYHAKFCGNANCAVPYCGNIKQKVKHLQWKQLIYQAQIVQRPIACMGSLMSLPLGSQSSSSSNSPSTPFYPQNNQSNMEPAAATPQNSNQEDVDHSIDIEVLDELLENLELNQ